MWTKGCLGPLICTPCIPDSYPSVVCSVHSQTTLHTLSHTYSLLRIQPKYQRPQLVSVSSALRLKIGWGSSVVWSHCFMLLSSIACIMVCNYLLTCVIVWLLSHSLDYELHERRTYGCFAYAIFSAPNTVVIMLEALKRWLIVEWMMECGGGSSIGSSMEACGRLHGFWANQGRILEEIPALTIWTEEESKIETRKK